MPRARPKPNGTAIEISGLNYGQYKAIMSQLRTGDQRSLREMGHMFAVEGNGADGTIRAITNAAHDSDIVKRLVSSLNERYYKETESNLDVVAKGTRLSIRNSHMDHAGSLAALKAMELKTALGVEYDRSDKTVTLMHEVGRRDISHRVRGLKSRATQVENNNKALQRLLHSGYEETDETAEAHERLRNLAMSNPSHPLVLRYAAGIQKVMNRVDRAKLHDLSTPEFAAAVGESMDKRAARENAQLAWAKRHRQLPIAKAVIKSIKRRRRNATAGGRLLNRAIGYARATAMGAAISIIGAAVIGMVKFLSELPAIAGNVHKLASQGTRYNIPEEKLKEYETLGKRLTGDDRGVGLIEGFLGSIQESLSSVINSDVSGAIGPFAAVSARAGGGAIAAMTAYLDPNNKEASNPLPVMGAMINDAAKLTFLRRSGVADNLELTDALHRNQRDLKASAAGGSSAAEFLNWLFIAWEKLDATKPQVKASIEHAVARNNGNFIELMMTEGFGIPFTGYEIAGNVDTNRAENVGGRLREFKTDAGVIKEGILIKILAGLDPVINVLRQILRAVLGIVGKVTGDYSGLDAFNQGAAMQNMAKIQTLNNQKAFTEVEVNRLRKEHGLQNMVLRKAAFEAIASGRLPRNSGMSWEDALAWASKEHLLEYMVELQSRYASEAYNNGEKDVVGTEPAALAGYAQRFALSANNKRVSTVADVLTRFGNTEANFSMHKFWVDRDVQRAWSEARMVGGMSDADVRLWAQERREDTYGRRDGGPAYRWGLYEPYTGKYYIDPREHYADLLTVQQAFAIAEGHYNPEAPTSVAATNYRWENNDVGRKIGSAQETILEVTNAMASRFSGDKIAEMARDNAVRVEVVLSSSNNTHTIVVKNTEGNILGQVEDVTTMSARYNGPSWFAWDDFYEAYIRD